MLQTKFLESQEKAHTQSGKQNFTDMGCLLKIVEPIQDKQQCTWVPDTQGHEILGVFKPLTSGSVFKFFLHLVYEK